VADRSELVELARRICGWAGEGEEVEAYVVREAETEVRAFGGEVESLSAAESAGAGIRVVVGDRQGFAYAGSLEEPVLADTLAEARDNAAFASPDQAVGLARPDGVEPVPLELWRPEMASFPAERKVQMALELERQVRSFDRRIRQVEQASYADAMVEGAVATTTGLSAGFRRTSCFLWAHAIAADGDDTQTGAGYSVGRAPGELDPDRAAADASLRATRLLGARKPKSGRLAVVLDKRVTTTLLGVLGGTLSGEAVLKGRSPFAGRLGEQVASPLVSVSDDPTDPAAYGASTHDAEGLACRRNVPIDSGVLTGFLYDTYSARRAGTRSTASAVRAGFKGTPGVGCRALSLRPGALDQEGVLAEVGEAVFVQSVTGVHSGVNPVSGDFSVGAEGLMVRGGALAEPVREMTVASTIQRMLKDVVVVGGDLEWLPGPAAGVTLAIADMAVSGA
jgi:PmbA protein